MQVPPLGRVNPSPRQAQHPDSPGKEKIVKEEREKINDAIKNIEEKILKIKLVINKKE